MVGSEARGRCATFDAGEDGTVTAFAAKPRQPGPGLADSGVYMTDYRIFDFFPEKKPLEFGPLDLELHVIPNMVGKMKIYFIQDLALDTGTSHAYEVALGLSGHRSLR